MGSWRDLHLIGQHRAEGFNLPLAYILGVAHGVVASVPTDEKPSPVKVNLFSLVAIVQIANAFTELVKQPSRALNGSSDFVRSNMPVHKNSILL